MKKILERLFNHEELSRAEARQLMFEIVDEKYNDSQIASLLTVYRMRPISLEEFAGYRGVLRDLMVKVDYDQSQIIDMCGTGGDGKNTFNISTLASVIIAGAGYKVAKHGNAAVSSVCGSSNVIQGMGYKFSNDSDTLCNQLDDYNITFMHAPLFHSALKPVGPVRRGLAFKTFFNMIGPLVNPAQPKHQLAGVFSLEVMPFYKFILEEEGKKFSIVHGLDGYDEFSLTSATKVITEEGERIIDPEDLGRKRLKPEEIFGADSIEGSIDLFNKILSGQGSTAQNEVVLTNAAFGIQTFDRNKSFKDCFEEAKESLTSMNAQRNFKNLIASLN